MRLRYILLLLLFLLFKTAKSQEGYVGYDMESIYKKLFMKSPEVASLYNKQSNSVNYSNGTVGISIPLIEIKCGDIVLPISLTYNSGGIRINEHVSWVGQNWTLNAEPSVSLIPHGHVDSDSYKHYTEIHKSDGTIVEKDIEWQKVSQMSSYDWQPDLLPDEYVYSLLGKSGNFLYSIEKKDYITYPHENVKVTKWENTIQGMKVLNDIKEITDIDGTRYIFNNDGTDIQHSLNKIFTRLRASSVISASGKDTIKFLYENHRTSVVKHFVDNITVIDSLIRIPRTYNCNQPFGYVNKVLLRHVHFNNYVDTNLQDEEEQFFTPIIYKTVDGIKSSFQASCGNYDEYNNTELYSDKRPSTYAVDLTTTGMSNIQSSLISRIIGTYCTVDFIMGKESEGSCLKEIRVFSNLTKKNIKTIEFNYIKSNRNSKRYFLSSIKTVGALNDCTECLKFEYEDIDSVPDPGCRNVDMWGYLNLDINDVAVPKMKLLVIRDFDSPGLTLGESGDKQILDTLVVGAQFKIGSNEKYMKKGILKKIIYPTGASDEFVFESNMARIERNTSKGCIFHIVDQLTPVKKDVYQLGGLRIKEIVSKDKGKILAHRLFTYGINDDGVGETRLLDGQNYFVREQFKCYNRDFYGSPLQFVGPYTPISVGRMRTIESNPIIPVTYVDGSSVMYNKVTEYNGTMEKNASKTEFEFKVKTQKAVVNQLCHYPVEYKICNDQGQLLCKNIFRYDSVTSKYELLQKDIYTYKNKEYLNDSVKAYQFSINLFANYDPNFLFGVWTQDVKKLKPSISLLDCHEHYEYYKGNKRTFKKEYKYNDLNSDLLTSMTCSDDDKTVTERYYYPKDSANISPYKDMLSKNIISPVIKTEIIDNDKYLCQKADYKAFTNKNNAGFYEPVSISQKYSETGQFENRLNYKYDDNANLVEQVENGIPTVYIWSYKGEYPVASISNCTYEQLKSFISKNKLDEINKSAEPTSSHWTLINNIRTRIKDGDLKSSSMNITTYTYNPLVGMTSQTDAKGLTIEYEYDSFGRLSHEYVKQPDGNRQLVKQYEYKYASQR